MLKRWNFLKTGFYEGIKIATAAGAAGPSNRRPCLARADIASVPTATVKGRCPALFGSGEMRVLAALMAMTLFEAVMWMVGSMPPVVAGAAGMVVGFLVGKFYKKRDEW